MAIRPETPLDAVMKMREDFIKIASRYGAKLHDLRSKNFDPLVAVLKGGGLALRFIPGKPGHYRLGAVDEADVACTTQRVADQWNRENPNHEVEMISLQTAVARECASVCIMINQIEQRRLELEVQS